MMNLELKDFSLYDFLNLSLIKIHEPFLLSTSKTYELVYVSKFLESGGFPVWNFNLRSVSDAIKNRNKDSQELKVPSQCIST